MLPHHNNDFAWYNSLDECKPNYSPVKVKHWLQFFTLRPKASTLTKDNLVPFQNVAYCYKADADERYWVCRYRNYLYEDLEKGSWHWSQEDIRVFRARVDAGQVWLLLTAKNVADVSASLERIYKGHFKAQGKVDYPLYLSLLQASIRLESYKEEAKSLVGFKTVSHQMEMALAELWLAAKK